MFLNKKPVPNKRTKFPYFFFTFYMIIIFSIEPIYREPLNILSNQIILKIQKLSDENKKYLYNFFFIITNLGNAIPYGIITIITYNFCSIFKTFILLCSLFISSFFVGTLEMIYKGPRPYFEIEEIYPVDYDAGWGSPSGQAIFSVAFYLTLWNMIFQNSNLKSKKIFKYISLSFALCLISLILASRVILAAHGIGQVILGANIGFGIYYFLFFVLNIDTNNPSHLESFLNIKILVYTFVNFFFLIFIGLLYYLNNNTEEEEKFKKVIIEKFTKLGIKIYQNNILQNKAISTTSLFFANFSTFMAMKFELFFIFKGNFKDWKYYNFNEKHSNDDESLLTSINSINNLTQWNHTHFISDIFRLIIVFLVLFLINYPFFYIPIDGHVAILFLFKYMLPLSLTFFFMFFILKSLLKCLRLTNDNYYSRIIFSTQNPFP
jgi:membrane-associated phospholipid phosphatase